MSVSSRTTARASSENSICAWRQISSSRFNVKSRRENMRFTLASLSSSIGARLA
jgi:hypothetical protein